jgi:hypothetical protein
MTLRRFLAGLVLGPLLFTFGLHAQATPPATPDGEDAAVKAVEQLGADVIHANNDPTKPIVEVHFNANAVTEAGLKELAGLKGLQALDLGGTNVTDAGLKQLAALKGLETLSLFGCEEVTDAGLKELVDLKGLKELNLSHTKVTDVGLKDLADFKGLQALLIDRTW